MKNPIIIALLGLFGPERNLFIEEVTGVTPEAECSDRCVQSTANVFETVINDRAVWLVDIPASLSSDTELVDAVNNAIAREPGQPKRTVHGLIYLQDIRETNEKKDAAQRSATFQTLLASESRGNVVVVTTLWDRLRTLDEGIRREAELKAAFAALLPTVNVRRIQDSDSDESIYLNITKELVGKIGNLTGFDENQAITRPKMATDRLHSIIKDKDNELANVKIELQTIKDTFPKQNQELTNLRTELQTTKHSFAKQSQELASLKTELQTTKVAVAKQDRETVLKAQEKQDLSRKLEQAEQQIRQLKIDLQQTKSTSKTQLDDLQRRLDTEKRFLNDRLRESETERSGLSRRLEEIYRSTTSSTKAANPIHHAAPVYKNLNLLDAKGEFPLYGAAAGGRYDEVKRMLEQGANASMRTRYQWTALHWAVGNGHTNIVQLLLSYRADVNAVSDSKMTVLNMAKTEGMKQMLRQKGAK